MWPIGAFEMIEATCPSNARRTRRDADPSAAHRAIREAAVAAYARLAPRLQVWRQEGRSLQEIAKLLNDSGERTRNGANFDHGTVRRILRRTSADTHPGDIKENP